MKNLSFAKKKIDVMEYFFLFFPVLVSKNLLETVKSYEFFWFQAYVIVTIDETFKCKNNSNFFFFLKEFSSVIHWNQLNVFSLTLQKC